MEIIVKPPANKFFKISLKYGMLSFDIPKEPYKLLS